ncbi:hypothetical protein ES319_A07G065400v1 [Gossypium barbadense]|uniref:Uncharacterized protein n=1 Tax=Gossypium barbadense TaxID=3634 RepID=A0A5J5V0I0_GOSBA|nr:hypothetical protein ES319_A07G065400v1 [Gossypium barbadense]
MPFKIALLLLQYSDNEETKPVGLNFDHLLKGKGIRQKLWGFFSEEKKNYKKKWNEKVKGLILFPFYDIFEGGTRNAVGIKKRKIIERKSHGDSVNGNECQGEEITAVHDPKIGVRESMQDQWLKFVHDSITSNL